MLIIAPWAQKLRNGKENPKNYPYWKELVSMIEEPIVQIGVEGEKQLVPDFRKGLSFKELYALINECSTWISVDSFFQHMAWHMGKPGIVIWGVSDPLIFGHTENVNMLKSRENLREKQFDIWEVQEYNAGVFVSPETVLAACLKR